MEKLKVSDWLPHSPPMRMLTTIDHYTDTSIRCSSVISPENPLLEGVLFPCSGGVELFSQASGILFALINHRGTAQSNPQPGAVIQIKSFELGSVEIPVGAELIVRSDFSGGNLGAGLFEGSVEYQQHTVFKGQVMIALFNLDKS